jgi:hypothetical protein
MVYILVLNKAKHGLRRVDNPPSWVILYQIWFDVGVKTMSLIEMLVMFLTACIEIQFVLLKSSRRVVFYTGTEQN